MIDRIFAELRDVQVSWKGKSKNKKTGKESDMIQIVKNTPTGAIETNYLTCFKNIDGLNVGDKIDVKLAIKAFNGALYLSLMDFVSVGANKAAKEVKV
ncbi:MAG: hypothetical protein ABFC94_06665 [Syntrophomonas sp.]